MNSFLLMLTISVAIQRVWSKSLFDYNINPEYDLVAQESAASYSNFWPSSVHHIAPGKRYKHHVTVRGYGGNYHGIRKHESSQHTVGISDGYLYPDSSDEYDYFDQPYHSTHYHHPHGLPPGQAMKHDQNYGHPYVIPPRFPPPPVYDKNFLNPWTLSATPPKSFIGQQIPPTTPRPAFEQYPSITTPAVYVAPKFTTTTTTRSPMSSTTADDQLMYDIDVRFGRD